MSVDFGEILTRAGRITWKHKVLWILGILAGCSSSGAPSVNYSFSSGDVGNLPAGVQDAINRLSQNPGLIAAIVVGVFAVICLLALLFLALGVLGRIGLITGTDKADGGAARLTFAELIQVSRPYFGRVFALHFLLGLAGFVLVVLAVVLAVTFTVVTFGLGLFCLIPLLCLVVPIAVLVAVLLEQADIAIVLEDRGILDGLSRGWQVINANWGIMIFMALILFLGSAIVSLIIAMPFIIIAFPAAFAFIVAGPNYQSFVLILGLLCACLYLPVLLLANGIVQTYFHSAWTLTFLRVNGRKPLLPEEPLTPPAPQPLNA